MPSIWTRQVAFTASMTAITVASRLVMAPIPNVKPVAFLTIVAGITVGSVTGFTVGSLSMLISDLVYFVPGPWTIAGAFFMGLIGVVSSLVWGNKKKFSREELAVGGFLLVLCYDIATSVWWCPLFGVPWYIAILNLFLPVGGGIPYPFGLVHELFTAVLLATVGPEVIGRITEIGVKR